MMMMKSYHRLLLEWGNSEREKKENDKEKESDKERLVNQAT